MLNSVLAYSPAVSGLGGIALMDALPGTESTATLILKAAIGLFSLVTTILSHRKLKQHIAEQKQQVINDKNAEK